MNKIWISATLCLLCGLMPAAAQEASLYEQGLKALQQEQYGEALTALEAQARLTPEDLPTLQALAQAYLATEKLAVAEATLKAAHKLDRNGPQTHFLLGELHFARGDYEKAYSHYRVLEYLNQADGVLYYAQARTLQKWGKTEAARAALQQGLKNRGLDADTQARLLLLQAELDPETAEASLQAALALEGLSAGRQRELRQAQTDYYLSTGEVRVLLEQQLQRLDALLQSGDESHLASMLQQPESWIARADNPDLERMFYLTQLEQRYERYPDVALLRQQIVIQLLRRERYEDLLALYRQELIQKSPSWSDREISAAFQRMADLHLKMGYLQFAFDNYERASEKNPRNELALQRMGIIHLAAGNPGEAIKLFRQGLELNPVALETRLLLALALAYDRKDEAARSILDQSPASEYPALRGQIQAVLAMPQRQPDKEIWRRLIAEEAILSFAP